MGIVPSIYGGSQLKNVEFCEGSVGGEQLLSAKKPVTKYVFFKNRRNMLNELLLCSQEI